MAGITSAGVGSGLDLEAIIEATVDAETLPKIARFEKQESAVKLQLSALSQMKSGLSAFNTQMDLLKDVNTFNKRTATITQPTDGDVISVTSESNATAGSFNIDVQNLAQGSRAVQDDANSYSATTDVVSATGGILTFTAGANTFDVTVAAGATLAELRTAINDEAANFGVSANIINTGGATPMSKLVFTSDETGTGNDLTVTNDIAELDQVSTAAFGGGDGGMVIAVADQAKDASIIIDGITATSATNTFANTIQDTSITLLKADPGNVAKLDIGTDKDFVKATIEKFVESYNTLMDTLTLVVNSKTADATARGLKNTLINQMGTFVSGAGNLQTVYDIGLGLDKGGKMEVKSTAITTLDEALSESYDDVGTLFAGVGGVATVLGDTLDLYLQSGGIIKDEEDALNAQQKDITQDRDNHAYRMELFEKRLREKYANLDVLIAGLRSQGTAITSALDNLPGFTRKT
ncbi:MAG: flagellar hook-associated protein 2 [Alteromonadaceae bacterium]|jgi:flagellar hook-associated protein 2